MSRRNHQKITLCFTNKIVSLEDTDIGMILRIEEWIKCHCTAFEDIGNPGTFVFSSAAEFKEAVKMALPSD